MKIKLSHSYLAAFSFLVASIDDLLQNEKHIAINTPGLKHEYNRKVINSSIELITDLNKHLKKKLIDNKGTYSINMLQATALVIHQYFHLVIATNEYTKNSIRDIIIEIDQILINNP